MTKLKDCPFCSGDGELIPIFFNKQSFVTVKCLNCEAALLNKFSHEDNAIQAWNNRHETLGIYIKYRKLLEFIKEVAGSTCVNNENLEFYIGDTVIKNAKELIRELGE